MYRNKANQVVCGQVNSSSGAVTSGTTTVYVTGDGGTQTSGSGAITHEGNGCWSYVPTQAETDYEHVAFTFVNDTSGSVTNTVNIYTRSLASDEMVTGEIDTTTNTHTPTTTEFQSNTFTNSTNDFYKGRVIMFVSGTWKGQATSVTGYVQVGGIGQFTVETMVGTPPSDGDLFVII